LPAGAFIGILAPKAAKIGSFTTYTSFAPDSWAASIIARRSVDVTPQGAEITKSGFTNLQCPKALSKKYFNIALVIL